MSRSGRGGGGSRSDDDGPSLGSRLSSAASRLFSRRRQRAGGGGHGSRSPSPPRGRNNERAEREAREARAREMARERERERQQAEERERQRQYDRNREIARQREIERRRLGEEGERRRVEQLARDLERQERERELARQARERRRAGGGGGGSRSDSEDFDYAPQQRQSDVHAHHDALRQARAAQGPTFQERLDAVDFDGEIPADFKDPIMMELMTDPITLSNRQTYDRDSLRVLAGSDYSDYFRDPMTRQRILKSEIEDTPTNEALLARIEAFVTDVERGLHAEQSLSEAAAAGPAPAQQSFQDRLDAIHFNGEIPDRLRCIFTEGVMDDPITLRSGKTYDRVGIMHHAEQTPGDSFRCPLTNMRLPKSDLDDTFTNTDIKEQIEAFVAEREAEFLAQQVLEQEDRSERNERVSHSSLSDDSSSESSRADVEEGDLDRLREARLRRFGGGSGMFGGAAGATHDAASSRRSRRSQGSGDDDSSTRRRRRRAPRE